MTNWNTDQWYVSPYNSEVENNFHVGRSMLDVQFVHCFELVKFHAR